MPHLEAARLLMTSPALSEIGAFGRFASAPSTSSAGRNPSSLLRTLEDGSSKKPSAAMHTVRSSAGHSPAMSECWSHLRTVRTVRTVAAPS